MAEWWASLSRSSLRLLASFAHSGAAPEGVGFEVRWVVNCSRVLV